MRHTILPYFLLIFIIVYIPSAYASRVALVIGNSEYPTGKLTAPVNDANKISKLLKNKDFTVSFIKNADKRKMQQAIKRFTHQLHKPNTIGFFYFSGHAIELNGKNYLLPIDANITQESDVKSKSIDMRGILTAMQWASNDLNMLVLDASRSNPYTAKFDKVSLGLHNMAAVKNALILFAASPGKVIADSGKNNGVFTRELVQAMSNPKLNAQQVFKQTISSVSRATAKNQIPWMSGQAAHDFYFTTAKKPVLVVDADAEFWSRIKDSKQAASFQAYLQKYGNKGQFSPIAKIRFAELSKPSANVPPTKTQTANLFPITIDSSPKQATIKILNIKPKYRPGILLAPGSYHIEVNSPGYQGQTKWVTLTDKPLRVPISLSKKEPAAVQSLPDEAQQSTEIHVIPGQAEMRKGDIYYLKHFDYKTSISWYKKASALGNPIARATLAKLYYLGLGVTRNRTRASTLGKQAYPQLQELAELSNRNAQFALANLYQFGIGVTQHYPTAVFWYKKAAKQNLAKAQNNLGAMYKAGQGVTLSYNKAVSWYRKAAQQGDALAQYNLAHMYEVGLGVERNNKKAFQWYLKAAIQGDPYSQNKLGNIYRVGKGIGQDLQQAVNWYRQAAEKGDVEGQTNLGIMYVTGSGVKKDSAQAVLWFRKAAEQGNANGQNKLGIMFEAGEGVNQNYQEAVRWFRLAAEQGNAGGQSNLGHMYQFGKGLQKDDKLAIKWYTKAADQGDAQGRYRLGFMYQNGKGVKQNLSEARYLYGKAAKQGHREAKQALQSMQ